MQNEVLRADAHQYIPEESFKLPVNLTTLSYTVCGSSWDYTLCPITEKVPLDAFDQSWILWRFP